MLFGYVPAVLTGFLLTAIPNWTGRLPLQGTPLLGLLLAWGAGRAAVAFSAYLGWVSAAILDEVFLLLVISAAGREITAGRNWRNLKVIVPVTILALANAAFHLEAHVFGLVEYAMRLAVAALLTLLMLMAGRIVPSFTRNWLVRENPGRLPIPFGKFDGVAISISTAALCLWVAAPSGMTSAAALFTAGILQLVRIARWAGERTVREPLVLAYAFVPAGFILTSLAALSDVQPSAGFHGWMAGGVGIMTLAVMTRARWDIPAVSSQPRQEHK